MFSGNRNCFKFFQNDGPSVEYKRPVIQQEVDVSWMQQDLLCMGSVTSSCMLHYRTRGQRRQGRDTGIYSCLASLLPVYTCIIELLRQKLDIILQMVCVHVYMCVFPPTLRLSLYFLYSPSRISCLADLIVSTCKLEPICTSNTGCPVLAAGATS